MLTNIFFSQSRSHRCPNHRKWIPIQSINLFTSRRSISEGHCTVLCEVSSAASESFPVDTPLSRRGTAQSCTLRIKLPCIPREYPWVVSKKQGKQHPTTYSQARSITETSPVLECMTRVRESNATWVSLTICL